MVGSHKILTVSYGTFSCTLEGFEDSFGTMKAIAEYFRDLAADDRYFGAVPPVPDAEMLTRIAEREIARRVEARMEASGIVLRVGQAPDPVMTVRTEAQAQASMPEPAAPAQVAAPMAESPAPAPQQAEPVMPPAPVAVPLNLRPAVAAPEVMAPVVAAPEIAAPEVVKPPVMADPIPAAPMVSDARPTPPAHPDADSVAAKLQRIRAVVGKGATTLVEPDSAEDSLDAASIMATPTVTATPSQMDDDLADILAKVADTPKGDAPEKPFPLGPDMAVAVDDAVTEAQELIAAPQADTVIDDETTPSAPIRARVIKMRRVDFERTVAAGMLIEDIAEATPDALTVVEDDALPGLRDADMAEMFTEFSEDLPEEFAANLSDAEAEDLLEDITEDFPDDLARDLADLERLDQMTEVKMADDMAELDDLGLMDRISDFDATLSPDDEADLLAELAAVESDADTLAGLPTDMEDRAEAETFEAETIEPDLDLMNIIAKVTGPADAAATPDMTETKDPSMVEAEWDDMVEDVANAEDIVAEDTAPMFDDDTEEDAPETVAHAHLRGEPDADEGDLSRILSQTDAELSQPEARNRREAIAQLKAAVAATEAARRLGDKAPADDTAETENLFREDLQQVVRPRRPMTPQTEVRSERPRPAPLKLVASQRVDLPAAPARPAITPGMPVRPRRVTIPADAPVAATPAARSQATSFAAFAEEKGATGLADLLEAAAAYTAFVEGVEDFSRPQILRKVSELSTTPVSREDGLRSFGTLLREGRIMKTGNGRFVVNEETRFNPLRDAG